MTQRQRLQPAKEKHHLDWEKMSRRGGQEKKTFKFCHDNIRAGYEPRMTNLMKSKRGRKQAAQEMADDDFALLIRTSSCQRSSSPTTQTIATNRGC